MPFEFDQDGTLATVPDGDRGRRIPTPANLAALGEGGGGVTVDNTVDAPVSVTSIVAPNATFDGDEATLPLAIYQTVVTLTHAQMLALNETAVELVPAVAGKTIHPHQAFYVGSTGYVAYTNLSASGVLVVGWNDTLDSPSIGGSIYVPNDAGESLTLYNTVVGGGFPRTAKPYFELSPSWGPVNMEFGQQGQMLVVGLWDQATPLEGGDPSNTFTVTVHYTLVDSL